MPVTAEGLLADLTALQRRAVTIDAAPLCVIACAGAGKTRVLTRRIAYRVEQGSADAEHVLALTFTRKAAGELQGRLRGMGLHHEVAAGTFHSMAYGALRQLWADRRQQPPVLLEHKARLLAPLASARKALAGAPVAELASLVEWAQARMLTPEGLAEALGASARRLPSFSRPSPSRSAPAEVRPEEVAALFERYQHEKRRRGLVDFDDVLVLCASSIESDPAFAAAQTWRWRHLFVDEFQDLNPLQFRLLLAWMGQSTDLCLVGDPDQAIYGWNGADPSLLAGVPARWPSTAVVHLEENHRCSPQIVASASSLLGEAGHGGRRMRSSLPSGPTPTITSYSSELEEASGIAAEAGRARQDGEPWRSMAVLTRTNAQLLPIQRAFQGAGIPTWNPFQHQLLSDPAARAALERIRSEPRRGLQDVLADLVDEIESAPSDAVRSALSALRDLGCSHLRQAPTATAGQWVSSLRSVLRETPAEPGGGGGVTLCSFHRAKGLEWHRVWVAGLEVGLVPLGRGLSEDDEAEERRTLYVALTRASTHLHCTWSRQRTFGARPLGRQPSPWLDAIRHAGVQRAGRRVARGRAVNEDPGDELSRSLRAWRAATARQTGVPAYVVMHDVTVAALASRRPRSIEELLEVPGLGPVKAARYGADVLKLCAGA